MAHTIRISDEDMVVLRRESKVTCRTIAGQVAYWMKIGRAIEKSPNFDYSRVIKALEGIMLYDDLEPEEQDVFFDEFHEVMWGDAEIIENAYAKLNGPGLDENGRITHLPKESKK